MTLVFVHCIHKSRGLSYAGDPPRQCGSVPTRGPVSWLPFGKPGRDLNMVDFEMSRRRLAGPDRTTCVCGQRDSETDAIPSGGLADEVMRGHCCVQQRQVLAGWADAASGLSGARFMV